MVRNLHNDFTFYIITSDTEFGESNRLSEIQSNQWNDFEGFAKVYYFSKSDISISSIKTIIKSISPDLIFVNGVYSLYFSIVPALFFPEKTIMHIRGMFHPGALAQKKLKKQVWLAGLKILGIFRKIKFSVSDKIEESYARKILGNGAHIYIAQNFPASVSNFISINKEPNKLRMVTIGLISPMKNHLLILNALKKECSEIIWDIYGPIKDKAYWDLFNQTMEEARPKVTINYKGALASTEVLLTLTKYHLFVLPSESENFGHAILESLLSGRPVITSKNTPWNNLEQSNAGYNVDLSSEQIKDSINAFLLMNQQAYDQRCESARNYAIKMVDINGTKDSYRNMFN